MHLYGINTLKWNQQGNIIATGGNDCSINIFDVNSVKNKKNILNK